MSAPQDFEKVAEAGDTRQATFDTDHSPLRRLQHFLHSTPAAISLIVLIAAIIIFGIAKGERFFSSYTLSLILQQIAVVGMLGAAQTIVILTAGIDLSVGVIMVFSAVIMGNCVLTYGLPPAVAVAAGIGIGALFGYINGLLVAYMKLPPFIVTLGTWKIFEAINYIYSANNTMREADLVKETELLHYFGQSFKIGDAMFTYGVVLMFVMVLGLWYVLNQTAWGRRLYALGDDPEAAQLAGVPVNRMLVQAYVLAGVIAALAAWVSIGRNGSISPSWATTDYNLQAVTAAVIGGISLFGGRGSILGTLFGALIVGVVSMGLNMLGADPQWKFLLTGVLIIVAVAVDQWIRKVSA